MIYILYGVQNTGNQHMSTNTISNGDILTETTASQTEQVDGKPENTVSMWLGKLQDEVHRLEAGQHVRRQQIQALAEGMAGIAKDADTFAASVNARLDEMQAQLHELTEAEKRQTEE